MNRSKTISEQLFFLFVILISSGAGECELFWRKK